MRISITTREIKEVPAWCQAEVARAGGYNIFGQPNFRLCWGWSRLTTISGWWDDHDENGRFIRRVAETRLVPKYYPLSLYHLEKWVPPTTVAGSPAAWDVLTREEEDGRTFQALGPFPSRGEYEHFYTVRNPDYPPGDRRAYMGLDREVMGYIVRAVQWARPYIERDNKAAIYKEHEQNDRDWDCTADAVLNDDNVFAGRPHVYQPSIKEVVEINASAKTGGYQNEARKMGTKGQTIHA